MHRIYNSKVCKKLPSLACALTLIEHKCINHPDKRSDHPKTRNCPFGRGQKSATNPLGKRSPHTDNAYFNRPRHKKGLPYVQSSKSALWFPFACFVNCCFFAIFVRCLALNPLLLPAPPRLWQPPPQGCDAHTHVGGGGKPGLTWMQWDGVGKRYTRQNFNLVCKIITD